MPAFSAWKAGLPYYLPPLVLGAALWVALANSPYWYLGPAVMAPGLFALGFFRDPPRAIPADAAAIVSPADGKVVAVEDLDETEHFDGPCRRISIFLSIFDVHVNRAPADGTVSDLYYKEGQYRNAMTAESSKVNEANTIRLTTPHGSMTVRQVSGAVARRIICLPKLGDHVSKGERIGMIKFGSRTELYVSRDIEICVAVKDRVKGARSVVARNPKGASST